MKRLMFGLFVSTLFLCSFAAFSGCGMGPLCNPGDTWRCQCGNLEGTQTCLPDGTGYSSCQCTSQIAPLDIPTAPRKPGPEPAGPEPVPDAAPPTDKALPPPDTAAPQDKANTPTNCPANSFEWQGQCYLNRDYCTSQTGNPTFPVFTQKDQVAMRQPYVIEFDPNTQKPLFCQTRDGYYYLTNVGYGICDNDGDGWINIFANQAVTSTDPVLRQNARCKLRKIQALVYYQDGQKYLEEPGQTKFVQTLKTPVSLVETDNNDGLGKLIDRPVYTINQTALPTTQGSACTQDSECNSAQNELCYKGNCVVGRRFQPEEINTLTKGCIAALDLNDNQLDDASETPSSQPNPSTEFTPLLKLGYFIELHIGYFKPSYRDAQGNFIDVWVLTERSRKGSVASSPSSLALNCQEDPAGFQPDYWRSCGLRDDQQCPDPNNPGKNKPGLSHCWLDQVKQAIPSLFQCVVFDGSTNPNVQTGYFHPDNYGMNKNYSRTSCQLKGTWTNPDGTSLYQKDFVFECTKDDGKAKPDPIKKTVGWACLSFKSYTKPTDHLASCIDEKAHQVCGAPGGANNLKYLIHEKSSYGLVRARRECGPKTGLGACRTAEQTCTGGDWTYCGLCNTCPQKTPGQKAICPSGVWNRVAPLGESETYSCKPIVKPSVEVCDGVDNDCDGLVDEGIPTIRFYPDNDGDSFGDATSPGRDLCQQQRPSNPNPWVTNNKDCDDSNPATKPGGTEICDGVDNNCDGAKDDNIKKWYRDADGDGFGDKKQTKPTYEACQRTSDKKICTGPNNCIDPTGLADNNQDCCDASKDAKPGQTAYFATSIPNCGGFDYNCDGNEERHIPVCQCSKTLEFYISDNVNDSGILHRWYTSNQQAVSPAGFVPNFQGSQESVYSNPVNCEFSGQAKFENKAQLLYPYRCPTELLCGGGTPKGLTMPAKSFSVDWTQLPKYEESVVVKKPYWIFKKSEHKANCAFMTDGRLPPCGTTQAYRAPTVEQTRLNGSTVKKADVYTGTFKACHLCSHPIVKVSLDGFFRTSANYVFTKQATQLAPTLKCR